VRLNHLNLTVDDVPAAARFLETYFGMRPIGEGERNFTALFDDDGLVLTLMGAGRGKTVTYPKTFHIGFMQATEDDVNELNRRLRTDGFDVEPPRRSHAWTFYVEAPGGFTVEVLC
jgi:lactoylglutathione lyase